MVQRRKILLLFLIVTYNSYTYLEHSRIAIDGGGLRACLFGLVFLEASYIFVKYHKNPCLFGLAFLEASYIFVKYHKNPGWIYSYWYTLCSSLYLIGMPFVEFPR